MTEFYRDDWLTIYQGDVRAVLPELASDSVDCIVTSPPYWGLRDYGSDGQLGLERTPEEYVANMVAIFRELRRVLKPSGTCWLNLGDSYAGNTEIGGGRHDSTSRPFGADGVARGDTRGGGRSQGVRSGTGLKPKDLVGIPWRVAFALQADGWYLRSDIIWSKPNPMPESVTDRPTKSHEYLFLLTKSARYYFDADAVREALRPETVSHAERYSLTLRKGMDASHGTHGDRLTYSAPEGGRNLRSVWTIATRPYPGAHFAVFPPELPERCIKAGSSERGVCPECGAPWERVVERGESSWKERRDAGAPVRYGSQGVKGTPGGGPRKNLDPLSLPETTGWWPSCEPRQNPRYEKHLLVPQPAVVLDPFAGSGTTGMVANRLSRRAILIDLNADYLKQQLQRNAQTPLGLGAA